MEFYRADTEHVVLSREAERELSREDGFKTEHEYSYESQVQT